jgi:anti-sigma factor RsiW
MKRYSDLEVDLLIDDISAIAIEAIERAAAEAARAAALAALEREAAALAAQAALKREVERWKNETETAKKAGRMNTVLAASFCLFGGLLVGAGGAILISR